MTVIVPPRGPFPTSLAIVGEAPGKNEVAYGKPFIGQSGVELETMLREAGLDPKSAYYTNVFKAQPENNDVEKFFGPKKGTTNGLPPLRNGKYLPDASAFWLDLLADELSRVGPRLILALGNTALWALTGKSGISKFRGVLHQSPHGMVLPTFHPANILRVWGNRSIMVADLSKAAAILDGKLSAPAEDHALYLNPTTTDFAKFRELVNRASALGVDIETSRGQITMIGFAVSPKEAFCIPFWDPDTCHSYWSPEEEVEARQFVQEILLTDKPKVGHNFLYDLQYLAADGFRCNNFCDDTILLHHALQPEMQKSLGFLGATYLNEIAWKELRHRKGADLVKKDE